MSPRLPTVEEMAPWLHLAEEAAAVAEKLADDAYTIRQAVSTLYTSAPVGVYLSKCGKFVTHDGGTDRAKPEEYGRVVRTIEKFAAMQAVPVEALNNGEWIKVAVSPFLVRGGQYLNFFPGTYPGGIPNSPGPIQSMLTSGLLGAGLGYGGGWLAEKLYPDTWQKGRLRKTLGILGAGVGAMPGLLWGVANTRSGLPFNDPRVLEASSPFPEMSDRFWPKVSADLNPQYQQACEAYARAYGDGMRAFLKDAAELTGDFAPQRQRTPLDVNVDALGRTLWESGASPQLAGMTMGALGAAAQMPGGSGPGLVTPWQMGELAAHMGAGYVSGALVGSALGALTGMPESTQQTLARSGMYAGIVRAIVPKLFGQ